MCERHASEVITFDDVLAGSNEAKILLHKNVQRRAQKEIEEFVGKKIVYPYPVTGSGGVNKNGTPGEDGRNNNNFLM